MTEEKPNVNLDPISAIAVQYLQNRNINNVLKAQTVENCCEIAELRKIVNYLLEKANLTTKTDKAMLDSFKILARSQIKSKYSPMGFLVNVEIPPKEEKLKPTMDSAEKETKEEKK